MIKIGILGDIGSGKTFVANQFGLFAKAIQQYEGRIPPQKISCVPKKDMEELLKPVEQQMNEEKKGV